MRDSPKAAQQRRNEARCTPEGGKPLHRGCKLGYHACAEKAKMEISAKSGSGRNAVAFNPEKVGVQAYKLVLTQLDHGEYGLLAPNAMGSASVSSSGKIFAFGVE